LDGFSGGSSNNYGMGLVIVMGILDDLWAAIWSGQEFECTEYGGVLDLRDVSSIKRAIDDAQPRVARLEAEVESLRCCCKCMHSDHDMHNNWWCEFDPEPMNPNEYSTIEPHENCHFSPSKWERLTYSTDEDDVANSDRPLG